MKTSHFTATTWTENLTTGRIKARNFAERNNNNSNNLYSAIPRKKLQARGAVHYQHQNPFKDSLQLKSAV